MSPGPLKGSKLRLERYGEDLHPTGAEKRLKWQGSQSKHSKRKDGPLF